jgi:hypothetical protein
VTRTRIHLVMAYVIIPVTSSYSFSLVQCNPTDSRTDSINLAESYPTPSLKTISTFSMSAILDEGSPF